MITKSFLKFSLKALWRSYKKLPKEVSKYFLKKSQKAVTVTYIWRLFTDKSCIKVLQKASQNCDDRLKLAFFGHCDQMRYLEGIAFDKMANFRWAGKIPTYKIHLIKL
jgi:hypothetical protein